LEALAEELQKKYLISIDIIPADLSKTEDVTQVETKLAGSQELDLLINNAGFGAASCFYTGEPKSHFAMLQVHVTASVRLARSVLPGMVGSQVWPDY